MIVVAKRGAESRANDDQIAGTVQTLFPDLTAAQAATYVAPAPDLREGRHMTGWWIALLVLAADTLLVTALVAATRRKLSYQSEEVRALFALTQQQRANLNNHLVSHNRARDVPDLDDGEDEAMFNFQNSGRPNRTSQDIRRGGSHAVELGWGADQSTAGGRATGARSVPSTPVSRTNWPSGSVTHTM
jgi:hypothetical protein